MDSKPERKGKRIKITQAMARKAYNNPKTHVLMLMNFPNFKAFWQYCKAFNEASYEHQSQLYEKGMGQIMTLVKKKPKIGRAIMEKLEGDKKSSILLPGKDF